MFRKFIAAFVTILFAASIHTTALATDEPELNLKSVEVIKATGYGTAPSNWDQRDSFAKTFARQAARIDALRNIAEMLSGVTLEEDNQNSHIITTRISHDSKVFKLLEKHARVIDLKFRFNDEGKLTCDVVMELVVPADWKN